MDDEEEVDYANIEDSVEPEEKTPNSKKPLAEEPKPQAATSKLFITLFLKHRFHRQAIHLIALQAFTNATGPNGKQWHSYLITGILFKQIKSLDTEQRLSLLRMQY